jgi:patatin-like phospholipase/acyl hydrolase
MDKIRQFYLDSGKQMFDKASLLKRLKYSYNDEPLAKLLKEALDKQLQETDATLGSKNLKTLLMMVMRNHTTDSPWPVSNNPYAKYNDRSRDDCNLNLPLWQLVRASTAAPTFFPPEIVTLGNKKKYDFIFVDGGVTTYNNPAYLAFQMATAKPYAVNWQTGADQMLIVSVGTGNAANARPDLKEGDLWLLDHAKNIPSALMNAATAGWDMACRVLGECRYGGIIDREIGDMVVPSSDNSNFTGAKLFTYMRYDPDVSQDGLDMLGLNDIDATKVQVMDSVDHISDIQKVGNSYANRHIDINHFNGFI